jgi:RNA polymerase sigma-70 factor (ECF subfamily)
MSTTVDVPTRASLLLAAGDPANKKAREAFADRYAGLIHNWCCRWGRRWGLQEADQKDVAQTILLRLLKMLPMFQYDPSKRFRGLLRTMTHRAIVDLHREGQRRPAGRGSGDTGVFSQLHEEPAPDDPAVEDLTQELVVQMERDQRLREVCERVRQRVNPRTWQAFWLTTVEDKPTAEVAQQLGMPKGHVLVYKHRVIEKIQEEFEGTARCEEHGAGPSGSP